MSEPEDAHYRFHVGMLVRHPVLDLAPVLQPLGFAPDHSRVAGEPRAAADGRPLPGTYGRSFWSWRQLVEGDRDFMAAVSRLADRLEPHAALLQGVVASGGWVAIRIALQGRRNIGADLSFDEMARLAALQVNLDIEVFPH